MTKGKKKGLATDDDQGFNEFLYKMRPIQLTTRKIPHPMVKQRWHRYVDKSQEIAFQHPSYLYQTVLSIVGEANYNRVSNMLNLPSLESLYPEIYLKRAMTRRAMLQPLDSIERVLTDIPGRRMSQESTFQSGSTIDEADQQSEWDIDKLSGARSIMSRTSEGMSKVTLYSTQDERERGRIYESCGTLVSTASQPFPVPGRRGSAEHDKEAETWDMEVNPPTPPPVRKTEDILTDKRSPYQKFFLLPEEKATRWRKEKKKTSNQNYTIQEKTDEMITAMCEDYVEWAKEVGFSSENMNEKWLRDLFDVGIENPAANGIAVDMQELTVLPECVVTPSKLHDKCERAGLMRQVMWDVMREKIKENKIAFGKLIPWRCKTEPSGRPTTRKKWLHNYDVPREMVSGSTLWDKLIESDTLDSYFRWLKTMPDLKIPKYLEKKNVFEKAEKTKENLDEIYKRVLERQDDSLDDESSDDEEMALMKKWRRVKERDTRHMAAIDQFFNLGDPADYDPETFAAFDQTLMEYLPRVTDFKNKEKQ